MNPSYRFALRTAFLVPVIVALALFVSMSRGAPEAAALDSEETQFLTLINDYRAQNGLGPLVFNDNLNYVARWMATDLATNNYFSHTDSLGRDPFDRMDQLGYAVNTWRGENLAAGTDTATWSLDLWKGSAPHNANMLNPNYTVIGVARAYDETSDFDWYWATEFGGAGAPPPPPAPAPEPTQASAPYVQPAPEPEPVAPAPAEVAPPPAPTASPAPATPSATLFPIQSVNDVGNARNANANNSSDTDGNGSWWHSVTALATLWTVQSDVEPSSDSFVRNAIR